MALASTVPSSFGTTFHFYVVADCDVIQAAFFTRGDEMDFGLVGDVDIEGVIIGCDNGETRNH